MSQNIRIGVEANTGGAEQSVGKLGRQATDTAEAMADIGAEAKDASRAIEDVAKATERLAKARAALSRETGKAIGDDDAALFLANFDRMRSSGRGVGSQRLRQFDSFEGWYEGHRTAFGKENAAAHHRRAIFATGMQGTRYSREYGAPRNTNFGEESDVSPGMSPGMRRAGSMAMGVFKGGLALAGINGLMSVIGGAVSKAAEEAISTDTLKRATGDLTVDFQALRGNVRGATEGMGMVFSEAQRLASDYARGSGSAGTGNLQSGLRSGIGFSRSYGMDPSAGVGFFATMRRLGVTDGDQSNRRLALMIGDSIAKSGNSAKADEVLQAISTFAEQSARLTLNTPNVGAYGSYLTSLMATGRPGLDPTGASSILSAADGATRRGGAMGEASLNFSLAALLRSNPNMNPVTAMGLMEGGLFGTTRNTFGPGTSLGSWYGARGTATPALDDVTNFEKMMPMLRQQYGANSPFLLDAIKNHFGLSSLAQASALDEMYDNPANLRASQGLLGRAGVDIGRVSATGIQGISRIASADDATLGDIYDGLMQREDLSSQERGELTGAMERSSRGNVEALREVMAKIVATKEQEKTEGDKTRDATAKVENAITALGTPLLAGVNFIKNAIDSIAKVISPSYRTQMEGAADAARYQDEAQDRRRGTGKSAHQQYLDSLKTLPRDPHEDDQEYAARQARATAEYTGYRNYTAREIRAAQRRGETPDIDRLAPRPDPNYSRARNISDKERDRRERLFLLQSALREEAEAIVNPRPGGAVEARGGGAQPPAAAAARERLRGGAAPARTQVTSRRRGGGWQLSDEAKAYLAETDRLLGMPTGTSERQLRQESGYNPSARSEQGALGMAQFLPGTAADMSERVGRDLDPMNPADALVLHREYMGVARNATGGNVNEMLMFYHGGPNRSIWGPKTRQYARAINGGTPLPAGADVAGSGGSDGQVGIAFAPATVTLQDSAGRARGQVVLDPFVTSGPSGT